MSALTLEHLRMRTTPQSFARGESTYHSGAVFDTVRRGNELEGRCEGSDYVPYHMRVTLDEVGNINEASCTCLYDWGGDCKHLVALPTARANHIGSTATHTCGRARFRSHRSVPRDSSTDARGTRGGCPE